MIKLRTPFNLLGRGNKLKVKANKKTEFLLLQVPIGEPIARGGPFVMNTKAEYLKPFKTIIMEHLQY